jgi:MFS family permease
MPDDKALFTPRFVALWAFSFVTFFSAFQLLPAIPFRILSLGGTKAEAGWFLTAYTFASAFAAPVMGAIADGIGRRRMLTLASILFVGFSLLYGVVTWMPLLFLAGMIHGAAWSGILSSSSAIITDWIPESRRTQGIAIWGLASVAAIGIAPAVGLFVYRQGGWLILCVELAVLSTLVAIGSTFLPVRDEQAAMQLPAVSDAWDWRVIATSMSLAVISFGYGGVTSFVAILARERQIRPESIFFTVFAVTIVFVRLFTSHLGDRFGPKRVLYPALAIIPIGFALIAFATQRWQLAAAAVIYGAGMGTAFPAFMAFLIGTTDPRRRARTFGSMIWAFDLGIGLGSLAIGVLGERYNLGFAFAVAAGLSCLSIPIFASSSRRLGTPVASTVEHG